MTKRKSLEDRAREEAFAFYDSFEVGEEPYSPSLLQAILARFALRIANEKVKEAEEVANKYRSSHISTIYTGEVIDAIVNDILALRERGRKM